MSNLDPSISLNALAPKPVNPLEQLGQFASAGNALTQLQSNRLMLQGAQAQGQAYRDNTDAQGVTNYPAVLGELAQLPGGAMALPQAVAAMQARQKAQFDLNQQQLAQTENRTNVYNSAMTPLLRLGSSVTPQDVYSTIAGLASSGFPVSEFANDAAHTMPTLDPSQANNPQAKAAYGQQLQSWLYNHAGRTWGAQVGVSTATPHYQQQDVGGSIRMVDTNPFTNPMLASGGGDANKTLSPRDQTDQISLVDPTTNRTYSIPRSQLAGMQGQGNLVPPGDAPAAPSVFGTGRYGRVPGMGGSTGGQSGAGGPGGGLPPMGAAGGPGAGPGDGSDPFGGTGAGDSSPFAGGSPAATAMPPIGAGPQPPASGAGVMPQPPAGMPSGAVLTSLGPGAIAARTVLGTQAGNEAGALFSQAQGVPDRKAMLSDMEADLANAPTGPGAQNEAFWSAFANKHAGPLAQYFGADSPGQVASLENFEKVSGRFAQNQATTLGTVTNDKLGAAVTSNPNMAFSTLGNQGVIHILQGNEDAIAAKNNAWQSYVSNGGDPSNYQGWSTSFNNGGFDPRVFWMKNMTPSERSSYIGTLSPSQASSFYSNVRTGISNGWVSPSDFASGNSSSGTGQGLGSSTASGQPASPSPGPAAASPSPSPFAPSPSPAPGGANVSAGY